VDAEATQALATMTAESQASNGRFQRLMIQVGGAVVRE
jgi:hypothetical protein